MRNKRGMTFRTETDKPNIFTSRGCSFESHVCILLRVSRSVLIIKNLTATLSSTSKSVVPIPVPPVCCNVT